MSVSSTWNGASWTAPVHFPRGLEAPEGKSLSCASPKFCAALTLEPERGGQSYATVWNGSQWSPPTTVPFLDDVSCPSAGWCMATSLTSQSYEVYQRGRWVKSQFSEDIMGGAEAKCSSPSDCLAAGEPTLLWNGKSWKKGPPTPEADPDGLSCVGGMCMAVSMGTGGTGTPGPSSADLYNKGRWSKPVTIVPNGDMTTALRDVSCATTTLCVAVTGDSSAYVWADRKWTTTQIPMQLSDMPVTLSCAPKLCIFNQAHGDTYKATLP